MPQATVTCATCPFARHLDGDRYSCDAAHNHHNPVVRGHWEATTDCYEVLEEQATVIAPEPNFPLLHQSAALCKALADAISEATDDLVYAKRCHDLDTFMVVQPYLSRLNQIWAKADARYWRRLQRVNQLVAA